MHFSENNLGLSEAYLGFFADSNSVQWYRGMSQVQTGACDRLLHALRDDMEQESTYRVRRCITQLGLHPLVKSSHIRAIMTISQGNDLAFLWFLWESAYKKPRTDHDPETPPYSVNEQLLLSGIAYLDMPATLRALDSLLPPPSHSTKFVQKTEARKTSIKVRQPKKREYASPYFAPQVKPRQYIPRGNNRPFLRKLRFPEYKKYLDGSERVPNENRWFAQYQLCPAKRIIKKLLEDELNRLTLDPVLIASDGQKQSPLCETHQFLEEVVNAERQKNVHKVLQRCLSQLDIPGAQLKARRKRIVKQMEEDMDYAADRIRGNSMRLHSHVKTFREFNEECLMCNHDVSVPTGKINKKANLSMLLGLGHEAVPKVHTYPMMTDDLLKVMLINNDKDLAKTGDCKLIRGDCVGVVPRTMDIDQDLLKIRSRSTSKSRNKGKSRSRSRSKSRSRSRSKKKKKPKRKKSKGRRKKKDVGQGISGFETPANTLLDEGMPIKEDHFPKLADLIPYCSKTLMCVKRKKVQDPDEETFVTRNQIRGELEFDYEKIFKVPGIPEQHLPWEDELPDLEDKQPLIENCCISALNEGKIQLGKESNRDGSLPPVLRAAANCAVNTFREYLDEVHRGTRASPQGDTPVELIDPNNKQQIEKLLKVALEELSHNPHYVLASFPNAHKLPMLLDWVADRYGKTFSREEMHALVKAAFRIYESIYQGEERNQQNALKLKKEMMVLSSSGYVTYHRFHEFVCQAKRMKAEYHGKLNQLALEQSRLTWLALRGYSHLGGHIKDTFFAYMPARMHDLKRQHVWRSSDYRDMVQHRVTSQRRRAA
ncbi:uncharacterized protein Dana_GF15738 [Drosophila ananassae]|uniref:DUF4770 domain-containing protein n=2 Tax=Drosophila ananassae TaxID=7217 RepID=B3MPD3_DROAN|nr:uncharacterized protein Dana_GF15738 [Drosophila ananassae]